MGLVSVQGLTILLSVSLIVLTGFIVGFVSITTGDRATEDAREAGQRGVESSLKSGRESAEGVSSRLLEKVLGEVKVEATGILDTIEMVLIDFRNLLRHRHPNETTDPTWIKDTLGPMMSAKIRSAAPTGISSIIYLAPPISPKAVAEGHGPQSIGGDGQAGMYYSMGVVTGTEDWGDRQAVGLYMSAVNATTGKRSLGSDLEYATVDLHDNFHPGPCNPVANYTNGETTGVCSLPMEFIYQSGLGESIRRGILNAEKDDGSHLNDPMTITFTPLFNMVRYLAFVPMITITHPEQVNVWPRLGNRVSVVGVSVLQSKISSFFAKQNLPAGSILYGMQKDSWTGEVGILIGTNRGDAKKEVVGPGNMMHAIPVHVTKHTDPEVAEHGAFMMAHSFDGLYNDTHKGLTPWRSNATGKLYYMQVEMVERGDLMWYLVLLVPHSEIMGQIDEAVHKVQLDTERDNEETDSRKEKGFVVMMVVSFTVSVVLMALSVLLTRRIVSPLVRLQQDMQAVATMDLERVQDRRLSSLEEVRSMQEAFKVMVANLREYRNYMPQSILVGQETEDEDSSEKESASDHSKSASETVPSNTSTPIQIQGLYGLRNRKVTYLVFGLSGWHGFCEKNPEGVVLQTHSELLMMLMQTFLAMKGVPETFSGDRLMGSFNAVKPCSMHQLQAVHVATACCDEMGHIQMDGVGINYAVTTGDTRLGNLGCSGMKKFTFISPAMTWAFALERVTRVYRCQGLVDSRVAEEVETQYCLRFVEGIMFPKVSADPLAVFRIVERITVQEEEWMYQLQEGQSSNRYREWNLLARCVLRGEWTAAEVLVDKVRSLGLPEAEVQKLTQAVREEQFKPLDLLFH